MALALALAMAVAMAMALALAVAITLAMALALAMAMAMAMALAMALDEKLVAMTRERDDALAEVDSIFSYFEICLIFFNTYEFTIKILASKTS